MPVTCDYTGISEHYEDWCCGDDSFLPVAAFYLDYLSNHTGVFAEFGVGTGRIARPLSQRAEVFVYGVDSCEAMLEQCRKLMSPDMDLALINENFLDCYLPQKVDVIYMPFRTIGHMASNGDLCVLFECVSRNLKPRGLFIFDHYMFSKKWAEEHNDLDIPMFTDASRSIIDRYKYDFANNIMHCDIRCNGTIVTSFDFRWFKPEDIRATFESRGFTCQFLYGDFNQGQWSPNSPEQIWVLRKDE